MWFIKIAQSQNEKIKLNLFVHPRSICWRMCPRVCFFSLIKIIFVILMAKKSKPRNEKSSPKVPWQQSRASCCIFRRKNTRKEYVKSWMETTNRKRFITNFKNKLIRLFVSISSSTAKFLPSDKQTKYICNRTQPAERNFGSILAFNQSFYFSSFLSSSLEPSPLICFLASTFLCFHNSRHFRKSFPFACTIKITVSGPQEINEPNRWAKMKPKWE